MHTASPSKPLTVDSRLQTPYAMPDHRFPKVAPWMFSGLNTCLNTSRSDDDEEEDELLLEDELLEDDDFDDEDLELELDAPSGFSNANTMSRK